MLFTALHILTNYPLWVAALLLVALIGATSHHWRWPLALECAAIVAYAYTAQPRVLIVGAALALVRWVPPFAAIVADALRVPTWGGLSLPVALFALPGLHAYTDVPKIERTQAPALPPVVAATGRTTRLAETHARPLAPAEWLRAVNDDPTAPHLGVVGATRLGKTTFVLAAVARRHGELVITTTKNDDWAGADVTRPTIKLDADKASVDWTPIARAINGVHFEMLRRNIQQDSGAPITLVIDEFTTTLGNIAKETRDQIVEIWSMGASCGVRVIVIAQEVNARAWGLEGRRDVLGNLQFARVEPGRLWCLGRLGPNGEILTPAPLDTDTLVGLAADAQLQGRGWGGAPGSVPTPTPSPTAVPNGTGTGNGTPVEVLRALRAAGWTREQARNSGLKFRDELWAAADK